MEVRIGSVVAGSIQRMQHHGPSGEGARRSVSDRCEVSGLRAVGEPNPSRPSDVPDACL